jgi:Yip1 domain
MNLVERVKGILLAPQTEWQVIEREIGEPGYLFANYVAVLAAVPAVAMIIGSAFAGFGLGRALIFGMFLYVLSCAAWYVEALIIDGLAPRFGAVKNFQQALKLAAYSSTAAWLAGLFNAIPPLSILGIVGLYSIYLLWLGLPSLMKCPQDQAMSYAAAVIVIVAVIMILISVILGMIAV